MGGWRSQLLLRNPSASHAGAGVVRRAAMSNRISWNIRRGTIAPAIIV
jgi:hypothetical protein